jgi:hypothetical protein
MIFATVVLSLLMLWLFKQPLSLPHYLNTTRLAAGQVPVTASLISFDTLLGLRLGFSGLSDVLYSTYHGVLF